MWVDDSETKILYVQTHGITDPGRERDAVLPCGFGGADGVRGHDLLHDVRPTLLRKDVVDKIGPKGDQGQSLRYFIEQATDLGVRLFGLPAVARPQ